MSLGAQIINSVSFPLHRRAEVLNNFANQVSQFLPSVQVTYPPEPGVNFNGAWIDDSSTGARGKYMSRTRFNDARAST